MDISIITWTEDIYYTYLKIMKNEKIIYYGYWSYSLVSIKNYLDSIGLELNYGTDNKCNVILVKYGEKFITIPDLEELYKFNYMYEPLELTKEELLRLVSEEDIEKIREIRVYDIVLCWFVKSNFRGYFDTIEEYKKNLSREIYFSDYEELNNDIENKFMELLNKEKGEIVNINSLELEKLSLYLNNGIIWEGFLRDSKGNIYLNTDLDITIKL